MAKLIDVVPSKTYATKANAIKAVEKIYSGDDLRYFIMTNEQGRFFPVFIGQAAVIKQVHFNFNVVA